MSEFQHLHNLTARLRVMAIEARERGDSILADLLTKQAMQYSEKAISIEEAIRPPPSPPEFQPNVQQQEQIPPKKE